MNWRWKLTSALFLLLIIVGLNLEALPVTDDGSSPFVNVIAKVRESVVNIKVEAENKVSINNNQFPFNDDFFRFFGQPAPEQRKYVASGSGFIFKKDGKSAYILTNNHVVARGKDGTITVTLADQKKFKAEIVGLDKDTDIAVIKITVPDKENITIVPFGNSDNLRIGDWAIAIGNPFSEGLDRTVTVGVISAQGRSKLNFGQDSPSYQDYIQTDAAINPGNSGGPLLNIKGEVIGVNAAITSTSGGSNGIGFAIPANIAKKVSTDLIQSGKVVRAYLGILPQDIDSDLSKSLGLEDVAGVLVAKVEDNTPASKAGFKKGDVIIKLNNKDMLNVDKFRIEVANAIIGDKIPIAILRDGKTIVLQVTLEARKDGSDASNNGDSQDWLGVKVDNIDSDIAKKANVKATSGVIITAIKNDTPAETAGLKVGDVILEINKTKIENVSDFDKNCS